MMTAETPLSLLLLDHVEAVAKIVLGGPVLPTRAYEAERYPSYGPDWQNSGRASVMRLKELGVYELANRQEAFMRSLRRA